MKEPPLVELRDVQLDFDNRRVLQGLNLRVERRERLVILGRSGAGKSTILRLLTGILRPNRGTVLLHGNDINGLSKRELNKLRCRIGMVYQNSALLSSFTVRENLAFPLEELGNTPRRDMDRIISEKLAMVGMSHTEELLPAQLSGGMKKRAAIARALVLEPELLLFDEPSAGLDPIVSATIHELILTLGHESDTTFIIVTHEMQTAFRIATRMAMLHQGRIYFEGPADAFRSTNDPVVERFVNGGSPSSPEES